MKKAHQIANSAVKAQKKMLLQKDKIKSQKAAKTKTKKTKKKTKKKTAKKKTRGCKKAGVSCKLYDALKKKAGGVTKLKRKLVDVMRFDMKASGKKVKGKTASMKVGKKAFYALARQYGLIKG